MTALKKKLCWVTGESDWVGNAFGYGTHNKNMLREARKHFDLDDSADIALTIVPADLFEPIPGKINVLFTMFETLDIPDSYVKNLNKADHIIVPCGFCRDIFRRYTSKPLHVCFEGVDPVRFPYFERQDPKFSSTKFRFLWCGAPNQRKGYPLVLEAIRLFEDFPNIEIYLKTTVQKINWIQSIKNTWAKRHLIFERDKDAKSFRQAVKRMIARIPRPSLSDRLMVHGKHKNIIVDTRKLSNQDLRDLYNSAHCFLLPSFGEGWGLTLCEAMATGAPCISVDVTGCADFFDDSVGYPIKYDIKKVSLANYNLKTEAYIPDTHSMVDQMFYVMKNYKKALKKGKSASDRIHKRFTWEKAGLRLKQIIEEISQ